MQTNNKDNFLSLDFGLKEFGPRGIRDAVTSEFLGANLKSEKERLRIYRRFVHGKGSLNFSETERAKGFGTGAIEKFSHPDGIKTNKAFHPSGIKMLRAFHRAGWASRHTPQLNSPPEFHGASETDTDMVDRFRYRARYFTDSGIIGTKAFVSRHYQVFKHHFSSSLCISLIALRV